MPSSRKESSPPEPTFRPRGARVRGAVFGRDSFALSILSAFAIGDYSPAQNPALHAPFNSETGNGVDQNVVHWGSGASTVRISPCLRWVSWALLIPFAARLVRLYVFTPLRPRAQTEARENCLHSRAPSSASRSLSLA